MDTKHGKRAHKRFLNDELGPENENNLQIGKVTWGHKYLRFCLKSSLEFFLSLPLTFPIYVIIYQHPKYHQSTGNMTFRLLTSKIDVLPISQDFPCSKYLQHHKHLQHCTMGLSIEIGERNIFESKWLDFSHFSTKDEFFHLFPCKTANILPEK